MYSLNAIRHQWPNTLVNARELQNSRRVPPPYIARPCPSCPTRTSPLTRGLPACTHSHASLRMYHRLSFILGARIIRQYASTGSPALSAHKTQMQSLPPLILTSHDYVPTRVAAQELKRLSSPHDLVSQSFESTYDVHKVQEPGPASRIDRGSPPVPHTAYAWVSKGPNVGQRCLFSSPISFANARRLPAHHELLMQIPYTADAALPRSCSCTRPHTPWLASLHHPPAIQQADNCKVNQ